MGPLTSLYAGRTVSTGTPSLTLNTPSDTATGISTTPTLDFTGITSTGDQNISYELQVDTVNTFDSNASTPAKVQEQTIVNSAVTPATGTMGAAFTARNLVVVTTVVAVSTANIVSAVSDGVNTYTKIIEKNDAVGGQSISVWYAWNVSAATNMSITFNDASTNLSAIVREYSGILSSADPLDKSAGTTGSSTAPNSGSTATTSSSHDLIFGAFTDSHGAGQTYTLGSGFGNLTSIINGSTWSVAIEDKNVTSTGTYSANATLGTSAPWTATVVAFKAATSPLIDAFSASGGHDAAQFADVTNPGDVDPFPSSDQVSFTVPSGGAATFGYTTAGTAGSIAGPPSGDYSVATLFTAPSDCTSINSIEVHCVDATASKSFKGAIWDSSGNLLTNGVGGAVSFPSSANWATSTFGTPPTLTPGATYYLGLVWTSLGSQQTIQQDAGTTNQTFAGANTYSSPTNFTFTTGLNDKASIYANYTAPSQALTAATTYYWRSQMVKPSNNVNYLQGFSSTFSFTTSGGGTSASVTQAAATLTFAGGTQAVATTRQVAISQSAATLTFAGGTQAIASVQKVAVAQSAATLTFAGGTQAIATVNNVAIAQQAATLTFSGGTQTAVVFATASITQAAATLTFSGGTQAVAGHVNASVTQSAATLTFSGGTQAVATVQDVSISQAAATLTFAGGTQTIATVNYSSIAQSAATLTFTGGTQVVTAGAISTQQPLELMLMGVG